MSSLGLEYSNLDVVETPVSSSHDGFGGEVSGRDDSPYRYRALGTQP